MFLTSEINKNNFDVIPNLENESISLMTFSKYKEILSQQFKNKVKRNNIFTNLYGEIGKEISQRNLDFLIPAFNGLVNKSIEQGFDLISFLGSDMDEDSEIIRNLNIDSNTLKIVNIEEWINRNFMNEMKKIEGFFILKTNQIPDDLLKNKSDAINLFKIKLEDLGIDSNSYSKNEILTIENELVQNVNTKYKEFGKPFNQGYPEFKDKSNFNVVLGVIVDDVILKNKNTINEVIKTIIQEKISQLNFKSDITNRNIMNLAYDIKNNPNFTIDLDDFDVNYLPGIKAIIEKYNKFNNIEFDLKDFIDILIGDDFISQGNLDLIIKLNLDKVKNEITVSKNIKIFNYSETGIISIFKDNHINENFLNLSSDLNLKNGDMITLDKLIEVSKDFDAPYDFVSLKNEINLFINSNPKTTFDGIEYFDDGINKKLLFKFTDLNISSNSFDYDKVFSFNKRIFDSSSELISFGPKGKFQIEIDNIKFINTLDFLAEKLKKATNKENENTNKIELKEIKDSNGKFINPDENTLKKIWDNFDTNFLDYLNKHGATIDTTINSIDEENNPNVEVDIKITLNGQSKIINTNFEYSSKDFFENKVKKALQKIDNIWDENSPSIPIDLTKDGFSPNSKMNEESFKEITGNLMNDINSLSKFTKVSLEFKSNSQKTLNFPISSKKLANWNDIFIKNSQSFKISSEELEKYIIELSETIYNETSILKYYNGSKNFIGDVSLSIDNETINKEFIIAHFLSSEEKEAQKGMVKNIIKYLFTNYKNQFLKDLESKTAKAIEDSISDEINKKILELDKFIDDWFKDENLPDWKLIPDFDFENLFESDLTKKLENIKDTFVLNDLEKTNFVSSILIASIIGIASFIALLIPIKILIGNNKYKTLNQTKNTKNKNLILTSTFAGLIALTASIVVIIYTIITKGGQ
ncbi:MAG: hypothetical protein HRT99_00525 [Mycoplasmatales bacterium]|nr:hypothetical protein [Mycoplasmatales bacterium]